MSNSLNYLLEPDVLVEALNQENLLIIDMCKAERYAQSHVPGAIHLEYANIVTAKPPVMGLLPAVSQLRSLFINLGINSATHVVAYDDEGGGKAARLLWTLQALGHKNMSLLNGGIFAWENEKFPLQTELNPCKTSESVAEDRTEFAFDDSVIASRDYISEHIDDKDCVFLDARSEAEYTGVKKFAERAGHIPGAINMDWMLLIDQSNNLRLKPRAELDEQLQLLQITKNQQVVVYCQTHHRSALSFVALQYLGFSNLKGYPGSWSEWGNTPSMPIELP